MRIREVFIIWGGKWRKLKSDSLNLLRRTRCRQFDDCEGRIEMEGWSGGESFAVSATAGKRNKAELNENCY